MNRLPIGFIGHGAPTNGLRRDGAPAAWRAWGEALPKPRAILVISAHWLNQPPVVGAGKQLPLIYDFYGFPEPLYRLQYPASGSPELAGEVMGLLQSAGLSPQRDEDRGLDHGAWVPLLHQFPAADIPVLQVTAAFRNTAANLALGRALAPLSRQGVFILGSGNIVHNLRLANLAAPDAPVDGWAKEFDDWCAETLEQGDLDALADYANRAPAARLAVPTDDHYAPLLVAAAAARESGARSLRFPHTGFEHQNLSMRCVEFA